MFHPFFKTVILIGAVFCDCSFVFAQRLPNLSPQTKSLDEAALVAQAAEIRQKVVHRFGTQAEIASFDHIHNKGLKVAIPRPSGDGSIDTETIAAIDSYTASRHSPDQIYDATVIRMILKETYPDGFNHSSGVASKLMNNAKWAAYFESQISQTLAQNTLTKANAAAQVADQMYREEQLAAGRAAEVEKIMSTVLTPAEIEQYRTGDYKIRARLFFKTGQIMLKEARIPNAFIIMLCDPSDWRTMGDLKELGRGDIAFLYPSDVSELPSTETKRWMLLSHLHSRLMQDGVDAFTPERPSESFLSKFRFSSTDPYDLSTPFQYAMMLSTLGPSGKHQYLAANSDERELMKKTAKAMYTATDVLIGTYVGQQ